MPAKGYSKASSKALTNMQKEYGTKKGKQVFYALANKRSGGLKGKNRGQRSANIAFKKGAHWKSGSRRTGVGRRRIRG